MTTEQTLAKKINWSWAISAIGVPALAALNGWIVSKTGSEPSDIFPTAVGVNLTAMLLAIKGWLAGKGTVKGSLGRKQKPATLDSTDPVGKGG